MAARKLPPFRFKKASYAKAHKSACKRIKTPSGMRWLCRVGTSAKKTSRRRRKR